MGTSGNAPSIKLPKSGIWAEDGGARELAGTAWLLLQAGGRWFEPGPGPPGGSVSKSMWKLAFAAAVLALLAPVAYGGADHTPHDRKFSAHMKANGCSADWDSPDGTVCYIHTTDWPGGVADGFHGSV